MPNYLFLTKKKSIIHFMDFFEIRVVFESKISNFIKIKK